MRKPSNMLEGGKGKGQMVGKKREDCRRYATCLVVQASTTFTLDLQRIQRVQTGFINPLDHSPRTCTPDICVFPTSCFPGCSTRSHTGCILAIDRWHDATAISSFPSLSLLLLLLPLSFFVLFVYSHSHHSRSFLFFFSFLLFSLSTFLHKPTMDGLFPLALDLSLRYPRIPFPRAMNLLSMILFSRRLTHAPDENLRRGGGGLI